MKSVTLFPSSGFSAFRFHAAQPHRLLQAEPSNGTLLWALHRPLPHRALGLSPVAGIWLPPSSATKTFWNKNGFL